MEKQNNYATLEISKISAEFFSKPGKLRPTIWAVTTQFKSNGSLWELQPKISCYEARRIVLID